MSKAAAKTGAGPNFVVALEQFIPKENRILMDEYAYSFLPLEFKLLIWLFSSPKTRDWYIHLCEKIAPGLWAGMLYRKRYIDEIIEKNIHEVKEIVNLGAGSDTRAFRLKKLVEIPVWEVDLPPNIHFKKVQLQRIFGNIPAHIHLVPTDFDYDNVSEKLESYQFNVDLPALFIMEGVTQYLTQEGIQRIFHFLAKASPGSYLVFTYVLKDYIEGCSLYNQTFLYKKYVLKEKSWLFGLNPDKIEDFLENYGWHVIEHVGAEDTDKKYGKDLERNLLSTPIERLVFAKKSI